MCPILDHIAGGARNEQRSAEFVAANLGTNASPEQSPPQPLKISTTVRSGFLTRGNRRRRHSVFVVSERKFDAIFDRIQGSGLAFCYVNPGAGLRGHDGCHGGRSLYFDGADGEPMEVRTAPSSLR
jgi:hypothetical protein